jgi:hypothetical protein
MERLREQKKIVKDAAMELSWLNMKTVGTAASAC